MRIFVFFIAIILQSSLATATITKTHIRKQNDIYCLTKNIYHESRGEPVRGQLSVAQVTINRTLAKSYPSTICEVVYQKNQFSWTRNEKTVSSQNMNEAYTLANQTIEQGYADKKLEKSFALYYHAISVHPVWASKMKKLEKIGNHTFYTKN